MQTEKKAVKPDTTRSDREMLDVVAFGLSCTAEWEHDPEKACRAWQGDIDMRIQSRKMATKFMDLLDTAGLRIRPSSSALLSKQTEWLRTIPPRLVYDDTEISQPPQKEPK